MLDTATIAALALLPAGSLDIDARMTDLVATVNRVRFHGLAATLAQRAEDEDGSDPAREWAAMEVVLTDAIVAFASALRDFGQDEAIEAWLLENDSNGPGHAPFAHWTRWCHEDWTNHPVTDWAESDARIREAIVSNYRGTFARWGHTLRTLVHEASRFGCRQQVSERLVALRGGTPVFA